MALYNPWPKPDEGKEFGIDRKLDYFEGKRRAALLRYRFLTRGWYNPLRDWKEFDDSKNPEDYNQERKRFREVY